MFVGARRRGSQENGARGLGQHFLKSHKLAASLVQRAGVSPSDLVIEVGAGEGILTAELARAAGRVLAVELDPALAIILIRRFSNDAGVSVLAGDFLHVPLPAQPFRVFGNIPFGSTTRLLRHLLDYSGTALLRADLIVERGVAIKRATSRHASLLNLCWAPWWEFGMGARIAASSFRPAPSVDAAQLSVSRRRIPLLPESEQAAFARVRAGCIRGQRGKEGDETLAFRPPLRGPYGRARLLPPGPPAGARRRPVDRALPGHPSLRPW